MAEHGDVNIEAALDKGVGRVHRNTLRSAWPEMRDDEGNAPPLAPGRNVFSRRGGGRRFF